MKNILIVDDEPALRKALVEKLSQEHYQLFEARHGAECLTVVKETPIDLILLDIMMPVMGGLETVKQLQTDTKTARIPVLILTNQSDLETISQLVTQGAFTYIIKSDHSLENIVEAVKDKIG